MRCTPKEFTISPLSNITGKQSFDQLFFAFISLFLWLNAQVLQAQQPCSTRYPDAPLLIQDAPFIAGREDDTLVIPTLFHVYYSGPLAPINPFGIQAELAACNQRLLALNSDLADVAPSFQSLISSSRIQLKLANRLPDGSCTNGIIYHAYNAETEPGGSFAYTINSHQYLNIHVAPSNTSFTILPGQATNQNIPDDCIVLIPPHLLFSDDVLVHEVGHWLGLYHTFGPTNSTGTPCGDDFIADTPPTAGSGIDPCNLFLQDCEPGVIENVNNFMDYSSCRSMFTPGQTARMRGVLLDPFYSRYNLHQPQNLLSTGLVDPPVCAPSASIYPVQFVNCDSTQVRFSFMTENAIPDSVFWVLNGSNISGSNSPTPSVFYFATDVYPVALILYYPTHTDTLNYQLPVTLNSPTSTLPMVNDFPFFEGFEPGFTLPNAHMYTTGNPNYTWQVYPSAGYESEQCLHVPAKDNIISDTVDLVIGTFDMTGLESPTLSFKVASSLPPLSVYHQLEVRFKDDCNTLIIGNLWAILGLIDMYNGNTALDFVPQSNEQWYTATYTFPGWTLSGNATLSIRLITSGSGNGIVPTAYYLDNFRLGDPEVITASIQPQASNSIVFPNPAANSIQVRSEGSELFEIYNAQGAKVLTGTVGKHMPISVAELPAGVYTVRVGHQIQKLLKL